MHLMAALCDADDVDWQMSMSMPVCVWGGGVCMPLRAFGRYGLNGARMEEGTEDSLLSTGRGF